MRFANVVTSLAFLWASGIIRGTYVRATPITADQVINYAPGDARTDYQKPASALGSLNGDTTAGGLNPFNPPFTSDQIVIVGAGGQLTLHLSGEVPTNGRNLGVFTNNGIIDVSPDGSGLAGNPAATFSPFPQATVSVSRDGTNFILLNGGNPVTFTNPTNYWTDQPIMNYSQPLGTQHASQSKPFLGDLSSFNGQIYDQIKTTLNNSAGGTWLDLRGTNLPAIDYVRFTVPSGRMVVDALGGLGAAAPVVPSGKIVSEAVGTGPHTSDVVVDFGPQSYDFQVHYDGSISGEQALQMLAASTDFRFSAEHFSFGDLITGFDYGGYVETGDGSNGSGYWKYFLSGDGRNWSSSGQGAGARMLSDGSYDGWVWSLAGHADPVLPTAVPEPGAATLALLGAMLLARSRR